MSGIKVVAPVTLSGFIRGLDTPGMALEMPCLELVGKWSTNEPGVKITELTGAKEGMSRHVHEHAAAVAARLLLERAGHAGRGLELSIRHHIPARSGLGVHAASVSAAVVLVNELLRRPFERRELVPFAAEALVRAGQQEEAKHIFPALAGGLILVRDAGTFDFLRIYMPPGLFLAVTYPVNAPGDLRQHLRPEEIPEDLYARQAANLAAFVMGMYNADLELIARSMEHNHPLISGIAGSVGALGGGMHGHSFFVLCRERTQAEEAAEALTRFWAEQKTDAISLTAGVSPEGCSVR